MKSQILARVATTRPGRQRKARSQSLLAPINGWVTAESPVNASPASALVLDNWVPTTRGVRARGGSLKHATLHASASVVSLFSYNAAGNKRLFGATADKIFDITSPADASVPPAAARSGQTSGYYSTVNFTTSGGAFLTIVNGTDPLLLYDTIDGFRQITDVSTPISITGVPTSQLGYVWVYRNRQFFVRGGQLVAHYLPVNSVGGALGTIDLNGVFAKGGRLLFGSSWSVSAGSGLDDLCVFVTDQGEVATFEGINPGDAPANWRQVGRYEIAPPMGPLAHFRIGGDLVIATEEGLVPLSILMQKDPSQIAVAAMSANIDPDWRREAVARRSKPWEVIKVTRKGYSIVSLPVTSPGQEPIAYIVSTLTGKWARFTGWDTACMTLHGDQLFFGTSDGKVMIADVRGSDDGNPIYYSLVMNPEYLGDRAAIKNVMQARATFISGTPFIAKTSASMNLRVELPAPPSAAANVSANEWDAGNWDEALWDAVTAEAVIQDRWVSIGRSGYVMQYQLQITGALTPVPNTEFVGYDVTYDVGEIVV